MNSWKRGRSGTGGIGTGKLLGYLCEEGLRDDVGILLQARVADSDKSGHRRSKKTDLQRVPREFVSIQLLSWLGKQEAYKNQDGICTFLPIFHIFVVQPLCTGSIHIEDGSRRVTVSGLVRGDASSTIAYML